MKPPCDGRADPAPRHLFVLAFTVAVFAVLIAQVRSPAPTAPDGSSDHGVAVAAEQSAEAISRLGDDHLPPFDGDAVATARVSRPVVPARLAASLRWGSHTAHAHPLLVAPKTSPPLRS